MTAQPRTEPITTAIWQAANLPFELWLRYAQASEAVQRETEAIFARDLVQPRGGIMIYTINVPATFAFDVLADSEAEARKIAKQKLTSYDPVNDHGGFRGTYSAPWVAVAGADSGYPDIEIFVDEDAS